MTGFRGMAEFYRLLKIEELDAKHPGLVKQVREWYASHLTHTQVAALIQEVYGEEVSIQACSNFYSLRIWKEQEKDRASYREMRNKVKILLEEQRENPESDSAKIVECFTMEGVMQQQGQFAQVDPMKLLAELRKWKTLETQKEIETGKLQVALQNSETEKQRLAFDLEKEKREHEREKEAVREAAKDGAKDPQATVQRILGIYGLSGQPGAPGAGAIAAVPEALGRG
jgi:hypothetical protein